MNAPNPIYPAGSGFVQLPSRNIVDWTPQQIRSTIESANNGSMGPIADLVADIMRDDRVRGVLSTRTLGMLGLPLSWDSEEPEDWYELAPEAELNRLLGWGLMAGVGFARIRADGSVRAWHPRWFRHDWTENCWYVQTAQGEHRVIPGMGGWIVYTPYGEIEPWNEGLWTALAVPWLIKRFALHDRARASEVFGSAMVVGSAPEGSTEEQRRKWLSELQSLSRSSRMVLPDGFGLDLLEAQGQTSRIYDSAQVWADEAITICIAGQIVTTEGQSGFSRGDIHQTIAASLISFGAETFASCLSRQYIKPTWRIDTFPSWDIESPERAMQRSTAIKTFGEAVSAANGALASYGVAVDAVSMAESAGIPTKQLAKDQSAGTIKISFAPTDIVKFVTVDEARVSQGLPPLTQDDGTPDPRGRQFISQLPVLAPPGEAAPANIVPEATSLIAASRISARHLASVWALRGGIDVARAPDEFRMFQLGRNESDHGPFKVTERSIELLLSDSRDTMIDLEHLSLNQESVSYNPDAMGWHRLEARDDGLYAVKVNWTAEGRERIESRKQRYISPTFRTNSKKEVIQLINVALTALPAMHSVEALIAASRPRSSTVIRAQLVRAANRLRAQKGQ